jgi:hypothetical protein
MNTEIRKYLTYKCINKYVVSKGAPRTNLFLLLVLPLFYARGQRISRELVLPSARTGSAEWSCTSGNDCRPPAIPHILSVYHFSPNTHDEMKTLLIEHLIAGHT